jgi:Fe-Mn family superoxide dismutase
MQFSLPALPYSYDSLEPFIDTQTMQLHHDKHHQTYVDKLNAALTLHPEVSYPTIDALLANIDKVPEDIRTMVKNHGGGHSNHTIFWNLMSGEKHEPSDLLKDKITSAFGEWEKFKELFITGATTHFGSGWCWLVNGSDGKLAVKSYPNQDSPLMEGATPVLGLDVWEHAYYLKYQNRRPEYITAFWNIINWSEVEKRLGA